MNSSLFPSLNKSLFLLEQWFIQNQRKLPFRENPTPYMTWISEIMAQQTTINAVIPYYIKFITQFPNIFALASGTENEILAYWSGLGYYSRAKNIYKTAQIIANHFDGEFPESYSELIKLPGIGRYTAGAILSIALNKPVPILDTNIKRVLSRLKGKNLSEKQLWNCSNHLVLYNFKIGIQANIFNQSLMELGATICKVKNPECSLCPISSECKAYKNNMDMNILPIKKIQEKISLEEVCTAIIVKTPTEILLLLEKGHRLWTKELWDLPFSIEIKDKQIDNTLFINYSITKYKIKRTIEITLMENFNLRNKNKKYYWLNIKTLDLSNPNIPISSSLKYSIKVIRKNI